MSNDELKSYFKSIGWTVEDIKGKDNNMYVVIRNYQITTGPLAGNSCDVAIAYSNSVPYVAPAAIHTQPALVQTDASKYGTHISGIGSEWQYWSRLLRGQPSPRSFVTHIASIFNEVCL